MNNQEAQRLFYELYDQWKLYHDAARKLRVEVTQSFASVANGDSANPPEISRKPQHACWGFSVCGSEHTMYTLYFGGPDGILSPHLACQRQNQKPA